ncbi:hypothetical protein Tco_0714449 [Tanacetum coccineum]
MAVNQEIEYATQCSDLTIESLVFQNNNVVGNFNYPQNVPAYKPICKFLMNCPLKTAFSKYPSVFYQNYLREFWCTAIAYDPSPPFDDFVARPLKEYLIKFSMMNGKKPLTLDFKTFCTSTGLDYNNGEYVAHPSLEAVKAELAKIVTNLSYLDKTPVLKNSFLVAWRIQFTFVIQVLGGNYSSIEYVNSIQQMIAYYLITGTKKTHSVSSGQTAYPQDTEGNIQPAVKRSHSPLDEGTRKSQPLLEGTTTDLKDSRENIQSADKGLPSMVPDEGTGKTKPLSEGPHRDKDLEGFKPSADMKPSITLAVDLSRTDAKYQADQTQSARLRYRSLTKNKGKTSSEVKPNTQTLLLTIAADVQALLFSDDDLAKSEDDVFEAGDEIDEDIHHTDEEETQLTKDQWEKHKEAAASYAYLNTEIKGIHDAAYKVYKGIEAAFSTYEKLLVMFQAHYGKDAEKILGSLKVIQDAVKEDHALNKKVIEATEANTKNSTNLTELLTLIKSFDF